MMILSLSIKNYALIEDLNLDFSKGFTVITGETGAGKSILIEAVELLCGNRADISAIRSGSTACSISGSFSFNNPQIVEFLNNFSVPLEDNTVLIRRSIENLNGGRSKAFINDVQVNISTLAALGNMLIDFHSQDEKFSLYSLETQLSVLDSKIPAAQPLLKKIKEIFEELSRLKTELEAFNLSDTQKAYRIDLLSFQVKEINEANLSVGEDEKLSLMLPQLKNAEKILSLCQETKESLYAGQPSALSLIQKAKKNINSLNTLGLEASELSALIDQSFYQVEEVYRGIEEILSKTETNPEKLNEALERNELLKKLKKKYGENIADILDFKSKAEAELETLNNLSANAQKLELAIEEKSKVLSKFCEELTLKRQAASKEFCEAVKKELEELDINNAVFDIDFKIKEPSANGQDKINFMFSANAGEAILPLRDSASGGEMSRTLLAIELSSKFNEDQTSIFDEIDAGTGGKAGGKIGQKLAQLSKRKQVFSITHLAQSAAFADTHIKIFKTSKDQRTFTMAKILTPDEHIEEIARMISGDKITQSALSHAQNLISASRAQRQ